MATQTEIHQVWTLLIEEYPYVQKEQPPEQLARRLSLWEQLLADIPGEALRAAAVKHVGNNKFFPAISELRQASLAATGPQRESAIDAWGTVTAFFNCAGLGVDAYHAPTFANPLTQRIVNAMGWYQLCISENQMADRSHFIRAYDGLVEREREERLELPQVREVRERLTGGNGRVAGLLGDTAGKMTR